MDEENFMNWQECLKKFVRKVDVDSERISSIKKKALQRLRRAQETEISEENASFVVEDYYEVIKELLVAYLLKNGLKAGNHQCLITYFYRENPNYEKEAFLISEMSFFRNRLNYYGEDIPMSFYNKNKEEFENIIKALLKIIKK